MQFKRDYFLQKYLNNNCYIAHKKTSLNNLGKLKIPFFVTYINKTRLSKKKQIPIFVMESNALWAL